MLNKDERPTDEELRRERAEVLDRIRRANEKLTERAVEQGVTFQLDADDTLRITIGTLPVQFYTQRVGQVRIHLDRTSDEIVGFVIANFSEFTQSHGARTAGFHALLPALKRLGIVQLPPQTPATERLREDFRELVPA